MEEEEGLRASERWLRASPPSDYRYAGGEESSVLTPVLGQSVVDEEAGGVPEVSLQADPLARNPCKIPAIVPEVSGPSKGRGRSSEGGDSDRTASADRVGATSDPLNPGPWSCGVSGKRS